MTAFVLIVPDGAADLHRDEVGRSPLEVARMPWADRIAERGFSGLMRTLYPDLPMGSQVAQLGMLGWDPRLNNPGGRASSELLGALDKQLNPSDIAFRANLCRFSGPVLECFSGNNITSAVARPLVDAVNRELRREFHEFRLYSIDDYRTILVAEGADVRPEELCTSEPHENQGLELPWPRLVHGVTRGACRLADRIARYLECSARLLEGERANALFPWSASSAFTLSPFEERVGRPVRAAIVGCMAFLKGIARAGRIDFHSVGNGRPDTNYAEKGQTVVNLLEDGYEFVMCHVNAPDEAAHLGDRDLKISCLESIDEQVVQPVMKYFEQRPQELGAIMIAPDHYTNCLADGSRRRGGHSAEPVPFAVWSGRERDSVLCFHERDAAQGAYSAPPVSHLDLLSLLGLRSSQIST